MNSQLMHSSNSPLLSVGPICSSTLRPSPRSAKWLRKHRPVAESWVHDRQMEVDGESRVAKHAFWHSWGERTWSSRAEKGSTKPAWLMREKPQLEGSTGSENGSM
jgi:hypothetical protein